MAGKYQPNPFQVLGLSTSATKAEIISRGNDLMSAASPTEQVAYRQAIEQLITNPFMRLEYELYEIPDTHYEDEEWEHFVRKYKRNPFKRAANNEDFRPPTPDDFDLVALLEMALESWLEIPEASLDLSLMGMPCAPSPDVPPLEVRDVIFG